MRFAIADPPYPPAIHGTGGPKPRGSRWYGDKHRGNNRRAADFHPEVVEWEDPARHRRLMAELEDGFDGWAIATGPDGLAAYGQLPVGVRIAAWIKPNGIPGAHRLRGCWEPIIIKVPVGRNRSVGRGAIPDVITASAPRRDFAGAKPVAWTHFLLSAWSFDSSIDTVEDLFSRSGAVAEAIRSYAPAVTA